MLLSNFFQNAYVTRDLDNAVSILRQHHGIEDFIYFEPDMEVYTAYAGIGPCSVKVAIAWIGSLCIEVIEPVSGLVQHYVDFLPEDNSLRLHHLCMSVDDWDAARAEIEKAKWPVAYEGGIEGVKFVYLDARDTLGHYLEYMWASPEMWRAIGRR